MESCQALITSGSGVFDVRCSGELEMISADSDTEEPATPLTPHPIVTEDAEDGKLDQCMDYGGL